MTENPMIMAGPRLGVEAIARLGAAASLLGSALVHGTVVSHHYEEWVVAGAFFLALQASETILAIALIFVWSRPVAVAVAVSSLGTVAVWILSRTMGMPFGPASFRHAEAIGVPDLVCCVLELLATALVLPWALGRPTARVARGALPRRLTAK